MLRTGSELLAGAAREAVAGLEPAVLAEPVVTRVSIMVEEAARVAAEEAWELAGQQELTELVDSMLDPAGH